MKFRLLSFTSLGLLLAFSACKSEPNPQASAPEVLRNVPIVRAESLRLPDTVAALGTVHAVQSSQLAAQVMGVITSINVHEGDLVRQGQTLATIDPAQAQAGLERAQAALSAAQHDSTAANTERDLAESTFKRYANLYERKSVSPQEFDEVKARKAAALSRAEASGSAVSQAKAAVAQAQVAFNYTRIRAPFDGVITARLVDPGSMASPGTPLVTIESTGRYRAEVTVEESDLRLVQMKGEVPVSLDAYPDQTIVGKVVQIVPSADAMSRTFLVKIDLPALKILRSGLSARANFSRGTRDAVVLPSNAVVDRGALKAIYVVGSDHIASLRYVTVGNSQRDRIEILSGVSANEAVIASPSDREFAGKKIEAQ